ncbi:MULTISPECIES: hypothetical protein [unclassified Bartonella]|uniref:hypothetical protein n=1 Tax=unclassified Bartonella TaxID=2645622 RepID=UPI0015FDD193|nr:MULTISPECIES: hypothetical protein [unclassified Bartonella]UXN07592.1 hypothetical protein N6A79_06305 [Bartonella sp. HY761]
MKFAFILITTAIILPSNSFSFKSSILEGDIKPYSQPLPAKTNYIAAKESVINQDDYFVDIDPIITGSHVLLH